MTIQPDQPQPDQPVEPVVEPAQPAQPAQPQPAQPMSKPTLVPALRATWRKSTEHFIEQLKRFIRLTALSAIPSVSSLIAGGKFDTRTLYAFILPFAEAAYRQVFPALEAAAVDSAPGATIVPAEVQTS